MINILEPLVVISDDDISVGKVSDEFISDKIRSGVSSVSCANSLRNRPTVMKMKSSAQLKALADDSVNRVFIDHDRSIQKFFSKPVGRIG
uniref:CBS domain-containing protein n=1 Tax=Ditylenchus dipsaci TaxID=166011 RepID=A0A915DMC2_9BILA